MSVKNLGKSEIESVSHINFFESEKSINCYDLEVPLFLSASVGRLSVQLCQHYTLFRATLGLAIFVPQWLSIVEIYIFYESTKGLKGLHKCLFIPLVLVS